MKKRKKKRGKTMLTLQNMKNDAFFTFVDDS